MFLEWKNNSGKLQIISEKFQHTGKFQNNAINDVKKISLSHMIIFITLHKKWSFPLSTSSAGNSLKVKITILKKPVDLFAVQAN